MKVIALIISAAVLFSCNQVKVKEVHIDSVSTSTSSTLKDTVVAKKAIPADTASVDYLIYLLQNEKPLNYTWAQKLKKLDVVLASYDSLAHFEFDRTWIINDSVSAFILQHSTGTSWDEYLLTVKNKKALVAMLHISDEADADVSAERPDYYYTKHELYDGRRIKLLKHKLANYDTDKQKDILTVENWSIQNNGSIKKFKAAIPGGK